MFLHPDEQHAGPSSALIEDAVEEILSHEDPVRFLAWFEGRLRAEAGVMSGPRAVEPDDIKPLSTLLGRSLWNAVPLPGNDFRPLTLPSPGRNEPCLCGSGKKFKRCCATAPAPPVIESESLWPTVLKKIPATQRQQVIEHGRAPVAAVVELAGEYAQQQSPTRGVRCLEPLFDGKIRGHNEDYDFALNLLCNLYDELGHKHKKSRLLYRMTRDMPRSPLRSGAWERLAAIHMDSGDTAEAWRCFTRAQKDFPDSFSLGVLEVQLLMVEGEVERAAERAKFQVRQMRRRGIDADDPALVFMQAIAVDPNQAMAEVALDMSDDRGRGLADWLAAQRDRPVPVYALEGGFDDGEHEPLDFALAPPQELIALADEWLELFDFEPPFSTHETPQMRVADPWDAEEEAVWSGFLAAHPEAFDSLEILDELATRVLDHPTLNVAGLASQLYEPLLRRSHAILMRAIEAEEQVRLPWIIGPNRPGLRALDRLFQLEQERDNWQSADSLGRLMLSLNPHDNHGIRAVVMDNLLRSNQDEAALLLAAQYPEDVLVEITYGRALALYRLGRIDAAEVSLDEHCQRFPKVVRYLTAKRVRQPELHEFGVQIGGDDQAWHYRVAMRDVWLETPGVLDWLKRRSRGWS